MVSCTGKLSWGRTNLAKKRDYDSTREEEEEARARARLLEGGRAVALGSTASQQCSLRRYSLGSLKFEGFSTPLSFPIQEEIEEIEIFTAYGLNEAGSLVV